MLIDHTGYWGSLIEWGLRYPELEGAINLLGAPSFFTQASNKKHEERMGGVFGVWFALEWWADPNDFTDTYSLIFDQSGTVQFSNEYCVYDRTQNGFYDIIQADTYPTLEAWFAALENRRKETGARLRPPTSYHIEEEVAAYEQQR